MLTVSFDPLETPSLSKLKKIGYVKNLGIPGSGKGWHFLTGDQTNIDALTDAVGFEYKWNADRMEWAHTAVIMVLTPDGRVSRYLYGVLFDEQTFKLSLIEASEGRIGTPMDQVLLYCFSYDASAGAYAPIARNIMKVGGLFVLLFVALLLGSLWLYERRKKHRLAGEPGQ
jgi:protein SCO1/2